MIDDLHTIAPTWRDVVDTATGLIGVPWLHQGRKAYIGLDCVGLLVATSEGIGIKIYDYARYTRHPAPDMALYHARRGMDEIEFADAGPGAVLCCRVTHRSQAQHFGILTDRDTIIHAMEKHQRIVEVTASRSIELAVASFRFRGVDYSWQP